MYQYLHKEYYPGILAMEEFTDEHWGKSNHDLGYTIFSAYNSNLTDHCFEVLREGIMCNSATTLVTHYWGESQKILSFPITHRNCLDWDHFQEWAYQRELHVDRDHLKGSLVQSDEMANFHKSAAVEE